MKIPKLLFTFGLAATATFFWANPLFAFNVCENIFSSRPTYSNSPTDHHDGIYENFEDLQDHEIYQKDYTYHYDDHMSAYLVMAIHGGKIEPGTSEIARAIAYSGESYYNLYLFEGLRDDAHELHITSTAFDHGMAEKIASNASVTMSLHGFINDNICWICLGGLAHGRIAHLANELKNQGLSHWRVDAPCKRFPGKSKDNIVNLGDRSGGIQIELSSRIRNELLSDPGKMKLFAKIIRDANKSYSEKN